MLISYVKKSKRAQDYQLYLLTIYFGIEFKKDISTSQYLRIVYIRLNSNGPTGIRIKIVSPFI